MISQYLNKLLKIADSTSSQSALYAYNDFGKVPSSTTSIEGSNLPYRKRLPVDLPEKNILKNNYEFKPFIRPGNATDDVMNKWMGENS